MKRGLVERIRWIISPLGGLLVDDGDKGRGCIVIGRQCRFLVLSVSRRCLSVWCHVGVGVVRKLRLRWRIC